MCTAGPFCCSIARAWALFAVTGTQKALAAGLNPVMAALMGQVLENNRGNAGIVYYSAVTV